MTAVRVSDADVEAMVTAYNVTRNDRGCTRYQSMRAAAESLLSRRIEQGDVRRAAFAGADEFGATYDVGMVTAIADRIFARLTQEQDDGR